MLGLRGAGAHRTLRFLQIRHIHVSFPAGNPQATSSQAPTSSPPPPEAAPAKWAPTSIRTGVIARKKGMTALWNDQGVRIPVSVLQIENCQVLANIKTVRADNTEYHGVQVGACDKPEKTTTNQMRGHFAAAGVPPKRYVKEFPITPDAHVPVGTTLSAIHFVPGQYVDVIGTSIGKGFQGGMKRWGFGGLAASHGVSISHRSSGSTGQHQDPGRIFPGKKMAGRMGNRQVTKQNLAVVRIDTDLNIVYVKGSVPGNDNTHIFIRDAKKKMVAIGAHNQAKGQYEKVLPKGVDDLPFPAGTTELAKTLPSVIEAPAYRRSPFIPIE